MIFTIENQSKRYEVESDVKELVEEVNAMERRIDGINLSGNVFHPEALNIFIQSLKPIQKLKSAILKGIFATLPKEKMLESLKILSNNLPFEKLELLDLSENALSCQLPEDFAMLLLKSKSLKYLKLNNCGLGEIGGNWLAETLERIENKNSLESIEIAQNKFMNFPVKLGVALEKFRFLEEIKIPFNTIDSKSLDSFLKCFNKHSLRVLDIRDNNLSSEGSKMLGEYFVDWEIEEMFLNDCLMGTEGLVEFLKGAHEKSTRPILTGNFLGKETKLTLDLSGNNIDMRGREELEMFFKNHDIGKLIIKENDMGNCNGLKEIIESKEGILIVDEEEEDINEELLIEKFKNVL